MTEDWTSTINLLIAAFTLAAIMLGAVKAADVLLGRRITSHNAKLQDTIAAIQKEFLGATASISHLLEKQDARLNKIEDKVADVVPSQNEKLSYIQGQSDTMLKLTELIVGLKGEKSP